MKKAFFLDRDGTINVDTGYVGNPNDVILLPGAAAAIRKMNDLDFLVIVVSNQSGVARGYFGLQDVKKVNQRINQLLKQEGAHIDEFYVCPHLKDAPVKAYDCDCDCRKPKLGLFRRAIAELNLDPQQCYGCGDKIRDVERLPELGIPKTHLKVLGRQTMLEAFKDVLF